MKYRLRNIQPTPAKTFLETAGFSTSDLIGDVEAQIQPENYFHQLASAKTGQVAYAYSREGQPRDKTLDKIKSTNASLLILSSEFKGAIEPLPGQAMLFVDQAQITFIHLVRAYTDRYDPEYLTSSDIPDSCSLRGGAQIEKGAKIGENVTFGVNTYVGDCAVIGDNVELQAGAKICNEGFGWVRNPDGSMINFPHLGGVVIGNDVSIGANTTVDRGNFGDTTLKDGCKIDNLVYIAHNAVIGEHSLVCAHVTVLGRSEIGNYSRLAPGVIVREGRTVGDKTIVGLGSVVTKDIPSNSIAYGTPAKVRSKNLL